MSGTSVPAISFTANGFVVPLESAVFAGVQADTNAAFGGNLNPAPNTPQGQLETSITAIIGNSNDQQVALYNGVDPAYASGTLQDAIGRIYFLERLPSQPTVLQILCSGLPNVIIPANALISDAQGNLYFNAAQGAIGLGGTVTLEFNAVVNGPTPIPAADDVSIYRCRIGRGFPVHQALSVILWKRAPHSNCGASNRSPPMASDACRMCSGIFSAAESSAWECRG